MGEKVGVAGEVAAECVEENLPVGRRWGGRALAPCGEFAEPSGGFVRGGAEGVFDGDGLG